MFHSLYHWLLATFAIWSADPATVDQERDKAAGFANVAYAALLNEPAAAPVRPTCPDCNGTGKIFRSDGGYVRCKCGACPSGKCKTPQPSR